MKATSGRGILQPMSNCYIAIPAFKSKSQNQGQEKIIYQRILPDISDSKSASYADEPIIGRATPIKTYSHSESRTISWSAHFIVCQQSDINEHLDTLRAIEAATYPQDGDPYAPPPICKLKCGNLLGGAELCAVMKSYSVKFPTDVVWDEETMVPYKFDVDMSFDIVYDSNDLPNSGIIWSTGG